MKQATINLYYFSELSDDSKEKAIDKHSDFIAQVHENPDEYTRQDIISEIEANEYLFFKNGELTDCKTYTGEGHKSGITELELGGEVYQINE